MTTHLDLDALADLLVGEGADDDLSHLSGCPVCSAALDDLEGAQAPVRAALAALPEPEVPAGLAARLDAALRRAREQDATDGHARQVAGSDGAGAGAGGPALPPGVVRLPSRPPRAGRWLAAAAAAVVGLSVAGLSAAVVRGRDGDDSAVSSAASTAASRLSADSAAGPATSSTGRDYGESSTALAAAVPALLLAPRTSGLASPATTDAQSGGGASLSESSGDGLDRLRAPAALADCLAGVTGQDAAPVALDYARYRGRPALVAVFGPSSSGVLSVYVVGAGCRRDAPDTLMTAQLATPR